jgi:hypothetical protein
VFGEPERGADAADRALRLNPNAAVWAYGPISVAYFMAGRYDDAVHSIERRPLDSLSRTGLVPRPAIYAAADRMDDAHRATADTLVQYLTSRSKPSAVTRATTISNGGNSRRRSARLVSRPARRQMLKASWPSWFTAAAQLMVSWA